MHLPCQGFQLTHSYHHLRDEPYPYPVVAVVAAADVAAVVAAAAAVVVAAAAAAAAAVVAAEPSVKGFVASACTDWNCVEPFADFK